MFCCSFDDHDGGHRTRLHHSPDGSGRYETDAWVFLSSDRNRLQLSHLRDGHHLHALHERGGMRRYCCSRGTDSSAQKPNFRAVAESLRRLGVRLVHSFAVTSQFKGAHDGIGGLIKNLVRNAKKRDHRIHDTTVAFNFHAKEKDGAPGGHFGTSAAGLPTGSGGSTSGSWALTGSLSRTLNCRASLGVLSCTSSWGQRSRVRCRVFAWGCKQWTVAW